MGVSEIHARGRLTSSFPKLLLITSSRRRIVDGRNKASWGISIHCKMSRDRFFAIKFFSNEFNQADLMRLDLLDCFYFKRKRSQETDRATYCTEWKFTFSISFASDNAPTIAIADVDLDSVERLVASLVVGSIFSVSEIFTI